MDYWKLQFEALSIFNMLVAESTYAPFDSPREKFLCRAVVEAVFMAMNEAQKEPPKYGEEFGILKDTCLRAANLTGQPSPDDLARKAMQWWYEGAVVRHKFASPDASGEVMGIKKSKGRVIISYMHKDHHHNHPIQDLERVDRREP